MTFLDAAVEFGAIAGGLGVAWAALSGTSRRVRRTERRMAEFHRDWFGTPAEPGIPAQPGVMERLAAIEAVVHALRGRGQPEGD